VFPQSSDATVAHDCGCAKTLVDYLRTDNIDAAIEAGLMDFVSCPDCDPVLAPQLVQAQRKLLDAWAARDRYRARNARLATRAAERDARRAGAAVGKQNTLPAGAAAVLARARAKAALRSKP
jgi:hypothetical protein